MDASSTPAAQPGPVTLAAALEREHRRIDGGIEAYIADGGGERTDLLRGAMEGLRRHIYLEEEFLFPPLREAGMMMPVMVMLREHGALWNAMDALDALLAEGAAPASIVDSCRELLGLLDAHNSKEEPIIYTRADDVLNAEASDGLRDFLTSGTTPEGWVSTTAR
ncbi:hemerythrin domain-containing protein [Humibacter ginsenosidimutans]|uniref:Hemerythrin domain-containing protein n=1 Tax=Humibacter ginsenosidimutans TaxID=2599293 RepID=A0A5B8M466_9MICO|nr:hemerythrin domain-containing protein [Humibacter ginsenosidimutans]